VLSHRPVRLPLMDIERTGSVDRRRFLQWLAAGPAALSAALHSRIALAEAMAVERIALAPREISLLNTHTAERIHLRYFHDGKYLPEAMRQLNHVLRDHRSGDAATIDPRLFDQLHALAIGAQSTPHFEIISAYRSPATNAKLRANSQGVAEHSLHIEGRALDVRLPGFSCSRLRDLAIDLRQGGVGYYPNSGFVHLDTGRVRTWKG
jgi:uncharacterized protein YcbK (DUF882 family)